MVAQVTTTRILYILLLTISFLLPTLGQDAAEEYDPWIVGPAIVKLGDDLAEMHIGEGYIFAGSEDTQLMMDIPSGNEVGIVMPDTEEESPWYIIFEYEDVGYVRDDDADEIDADAILESYQEGTEAANEQRADMGLPALHVTGWYETPIYDDKTHNLRWALLGAKEGGNDFVNYNTRLLGREGYMSVILVSGPDQLNEFKPEVEELLANFNYIEGKRYLDFVEGDKVAEYGLVALVAGGAGVAAAKLGLFAGLAKFFGKFWKMLLVGIAAIGAALKKLVFGKKANTHTSAE